MKIISLPKSQLRVATHITMMQNLLTYLTPLAEQDTRVADLKAKLLLAVQKEDTDFKADTASDRTAVISDADTTRDRCYGIISTVARAFSQGYGSDAQTEAAKAIVALAGKYNVQVAAQLDQEYGTLRQFINEAEQRAINFEVLALDGIFTKMKTANETVNTELMNRDIDRSAIQAGQIKADRQAVDAIYDCIIDYANAMLGIAPTAQLEAFALQWSKYVERIRQQQFGDSTQSASSGDASSDTDAPKPDSDTEGSGTSGSTGGSDHEIHDGVTEW